jgi:acyl carrier protein
MNSTAIPQGSALEETIRHFIVSHFLYGDTSRGPRSDESLLESGTIDSTGVLDLVAFLEQTFRIRIETDEIVPENLDSIANVSAFLQRKLAG